MLKKTTPTRRETVTIEDRRVVLLAAKARKPRDIETMSQEDFVRRELKARLGWPQKDPAPAAVKAAAFDLACKISGEALVALAKKRAAEMKAQAVKDAEALRMQSLAELVEGA